MAEVRRWTIRKTEWDEQDGLETEYSVLDPESYTIYAGVPKITDIEVISKSDLQSLLDSLKSRCTHGPLTEGCSVACDYCWVLRRIEEEINGKEG